MPDCPTCQSQHTVKNGHIHNGKQRFLCRQCGRQFVENPAHKTIDADTRALIDRLLLERLSMAGIARAVQVSESWLQDYVNVKAAQTPQKAVVQPKKRAFKSAMRRTVVIRGQQGQQAVGLAGSGRVYPRNHRCSCWVERAREC